MVVNEEIFNKEIEKVVKKPKRKLSEKQLENLAKGREKMKLKREQAKTQKDDKTKEKVEKKVLKESDKCAKKGQVENRKAHKEKRRTLKEINAEKEQKILERLEKQELDKSNKKNSRMDLFTSLKVKCLQEAKSVHEYKEIKQALDGIDEDTLHNDDKLKDYAKKVMSVYTKKEPLKKIEEEQE